MKFPQDQNFIMRWLRDFLCGALIGAGAILPGVSGGLLAVVFGIYRPLMEMLTQPKTAIRKYWSRIPPIILGWCAGFLGFAVGISAAFSVSDAVTTWLFIGLIAGTMPSLFREAGKEGRAVSAWVSIAVCALSVFVGLYYISYVLNVTVTPNFWWYNFCGALWGASVVIPGLTSSSIMMALGLYQPMLDGLAQLDLLVLSSCLPGMGLAGPAGYLVFPHALCCGVPRNTGYCTGIHAGNCSHGIWFRRDFWLGALLHRRIFTGLFNEQDGSANSERLNNAE